MDKIIATLSDTTFWATFVGGGVFVFILEQIVYYFRKEKKILGYTIDTRTLIEKSDPNLKITYSGMDVDFVHSHNITIRNIGNTCLKDVPVFIYPSGSTTQRFYFAKISAKLGIHCDKLEKEPGFAFAFNLLNPGDEIKVDLVTLNSAGDVINIDARAEHLKVRNITETRTNAQLIELAIDASAFSPAWALFKILKSTKK